MGHADGDVGAYLAARQAEAAHDFTAAADYYAHALRGDPVNAAMLDSAQRMLAAKGDMGGAALMAQALVDQGGGNSIAHLMLNLRNVKAGDWQAVLDNRSGGRQIGPLVDGLAIGWAYMGMGDVTRALDSFDAVIAHDAMSVYGMHHKAYALASVGDFEGAELLLSNNGQGNMRYSRQSAIAHVQILSQLGDNTRALTVLEGVFGRDLDPELEQMRNALRAGDALAYDAVRTPRQAMGALYMVVARILNVDAPDDFTLIYARAATDLWPQNATAQLLAAGLLEDLGQYDLASEAYGQVSVDNPAHYAAELGRADVLRAAGRDDDAMEVLEALIRRYPQMPEIHATKGDTLREAGAYGDADRAYSQALALYSDDDAAKWFVHYTRAISRHKLDDWTGAEADFRAALALNPDQPQVLNYLGYSLVERGEKLDEALDMIETAVAASPDQAAIVDSLGWALYQRGQYEEAVVHLERAASLAPTSAVINDHLGDALWSVGRHTEAAFHWQRALSFEPEDVDELRIRAKLESGLDAVLADEGALPMQVVGEDS